MNDALKKQLGETPLVDAETIEEARRTLAPHSQPVSKRIHEHTRATRLARYTLACSLSYLLTT